MGRKKRYSGHFCWVCGRIRPNERFSGGGHKHHICKDCHKLGPKEIAYQQEVRNIERCFDWNGRIYRKQRMSFERFLNHSNPRVREYAQGLQLNMEKENQAWKALIEEDNRECEEWVDGLNPDGQDLEAQVDPLSTSIGMMFNEDLPF